MLPSTTVIPPGRDTARKRKLQDIRISPESVPSEDILLRGESDDDSDETRAWKKARREAFALHYLEHGWVPIMTAKLKGPFDNDWKNPWAKRKTMYIEKDLTRYEEDLARYQEESLSPTVHRVGGKIAKSLVSDPTSKGFQLPKTPSKTGLQDTSQSKLSSSKSIYRDKSLRGDEQRHKQSSTVLPLDTARPRSPSHQLHKQLRDTASRQIVQGSPKPSLDLEIDKQTHLGLLRSPGSHSLSHKLFQQLHTKLDDINGFTNDPKSYHLEGLRPPGNNPATGITSQDHKSEPQEDRPEQIFESTLQLEDELKQLWNSANVSNLNGISSAIEWKYTEAEPNVFDGSKTRHKAKRRRIMVYGEVPIILEDGRVNRFSNHQLRDIRTKLSNGLASVQRRFDTIKAAQNTSDIIACCEITLQLAQTLEKVDYLRRLHKVARSQPRRVKSGLEAYAILNEYQDHPVPDSLSDFTESSNVIESDGYLVEQHREAEKKELDKQPDLNQDVLRPLANQNQLKQGWTVSNPHDQPLDDADNDAYTHGDTDMTKASDLDSTKVPLGNMRGSKQTVPGAAKIPGENKPMVRKKAHKFVSTLNSEERLANRENLAREIVASASNLGLDANVHGAASDRLTNGDIVFARDTERPFANTADDDNNLSIDSDAESGNRNQNAGSTRGIDSDEPTLASIASVKEVKNPVVKSLGDGISRVDEAHFVHGGSTQANTPDTPQLLGSLSQEVQIPRSSDEQTQQQYLAKTLSTSKSFKQPGRRLLANAGSNQPEIIQITSEVEQKTENNFPLSSATQNHHKQYDATDAGQPETANNSGLANIGIPAGSGTKEMSTNRDVTIVQLDSESDSHTSENDAQYHSAPKTIKSCNEETLHSTLGIGTSDAARAEDSVSGNGKPDVSQAIKPSEPTNSQSRIAQFTNYLQDIHFKTWKKTVQMSRGQPENHLPSNPPTKSSSTTKIDVLQGQGSHQSDLPSSLSHSKPIEKIPNSEVQQITQSEFVGTSIQNRATERPSLASKSTLENRRASSQSAYVTNASLDPRVALKNRTGISSSAEASTTSVSTMQPPSGKYKSKLYSASQPLAHNQPQQFIKYSRPMSKATMAQQGEPQTSSDARSASARLHGPLQRSTETSLEDAQRRTPPITESEEREALDAASSLLGNWDVEKEAYTAR
ncbi:MAG: hypothetical protein GOMPHAMPRED_000283 [Gomphillus americanus]|uniref:Uncharacterized protein n=1 Tax=Gomphillus americanus TaxID=1940652 RepID=A0A8H3EGD1_9LECA|nr:MAG: hypothetical protein GOMPHAMPRED_000283 [Gomphillus americanus]